VTLSSGRLAGQVALVTGAGRGQGRAHAVALASQGASVVLADLGGGAGTTMPYRLSGPEELEETARQVRQAGTEALVVPTDVRRPEDVARLVARAIEAWGRLDVLVANAGVCATRPLEQIDDACWGDMLATNLSGVFYCIREAAPYMRAARRGRIVVVASMAARRGMSHLAHYCATKFGLVGLAKAAALELLPDGITVHVLCPTTVDTPMIHYRENYSAFCPDLAEPSREEAAERFAALNPMGVPWLRPEDVAEVMLQVVLTGSYQSGAVVEIGAGVSAQLP
jgi:NAD(P)-dependent dehydrogenase (short-subunit alcohol dehydrogenase family)